MVVYLRQNAIEGPWPAAERILVCVGTDPLSETVVRAGSRLARIELHSGQEGLLKSLDDKKTPVTGENFRNEMLAMKSFALPLTGKTTLGADHTVVKPVYLMEVKGGKWTRKAVVGE